MPDTERLIYTAQGAISYFAGSQPELPKGFSQTLDVKISPHIVFTFWDAPKYSKGTYLMDELKRKFAGNGLPIGVGLFTRPMGDVLPEKYGFDYDSSKLQEFLSAACSRSLPFFIITSGMHWTEVANRKSPLLRKLEDRRENLMLYEDGKRVERKIQPPGNLLKGLLGSDGNGVLYLSPYAPEVQSYREKNLAQMASLIAQYAKVYPNLFLGISTENEIDYPGEWITGGRKLLQQADVSMSFDQFRELTVQRVLRRNVAIFSSAGLAKIYTNQSIEDANNRASPLESAYIPGSEVGITTWRTGNIETYKKAQDLAAKHNSGWALVVSNPLSRNLGANIRELQAAINYEPDIVGIYNWWPHFWGYGVRNMPLETAIKNFTR